MAVNATNRLIAPDVRGANFGSLLVAEAGETQSNGTTETPVQTKDGKYEGHGVLGHLVKVEGTVDDPKERANIIQNCDWICKNAGAILKQADENIKSGRVPWYGLKESPELKMSGRLSFLSGGTDREIYSNNILLYQKANAIRLSLRQGTKVGFIFDLDGCISGKKRRPYATREAQPLEQIYELYMVITLLTKLGLKVTTNTNRAALTTPTLVRPKALNPVTNIAPHNGPMGEIIGLDPRAACEMSKSLGIGALSTGFRDMPGKHTFIHPKLRLAYDLLDELGPKFWKDFVIDAAIEYECTTVEPKGLNSLLMLQDSCSAPSYKSFLKISAIKDHYVKNGTEEEYKNFQKELQDHIKDRDKILKCLTDLKTLLINVLNEESVTPADRDTKRNELDSIKLKSIFSEKPSLSWGEDSESIKRDLEEVEKTIVSYVSLPGEDKPDSKRIDYTDSFGRKQRVLNPFHLLLHKPQMFDRKIRRNAHTSVCFHYDNPRNIKREELVDRQISRLETAENSYRVVDGKKVKLRHLIQEANHRMLSGDKLSEAEKASIDRFIKEGEKELKPDENGTVNLTNAKEYVLWRLQKFIALRNTKKEIEKLKIHDIKVFNCSNKKEVKFTEEFKNRIADTDSLKHFIEKLRQEFVTVGGLGVELAHYAGDIYTEKFIKDIDLSRTAKLEEERKCPDYLFCINYQERYSSKKDLLSTFVLEDKRGKKQDYAELLVNLAKAELVPDCSTTYEDEDISFTFGDSTSDMSAHIQALLSFTYVNGEIHGGVASQIYNLLTEDDYKDAAIKKLIEFVDDAKAKRFENFSDFCSKTGLYGLKEEKDSSENVIGYKKVIGIKEQEIKNQDGNVVSTLQNDIYADNGNIFSKEDIQKDFIEYFARHRIVTNEAPDANIRRLFEVLCHIHGHKISDREFKREDLKRAIACSKKNEESRTDEEKELLSRYKSVIVELERGRDMPFDTPDSRKYFEYLDDSTGEKYYRDKETRFLTTRSGKVYKGDENNLRRRAIIDEVVGDQYGVMVYEDSIKGENSLENGQVEIFNDLDFLNTKCLYEDSALPPCSPPSGLFSSKALVGILGGGEKGINNLKYLISKMPMVFSKLLEWSGGLMAVGGVSRIVSGLFGASEESTLYRGGYWVSNIARAVSACGGGLRGLIHPQKYYDITMGEAVNAFSAIFLPNGSKHLGLAFGNLVLFTGRGRQSIQRQLSTNLKPAKNGVVIKDPREEDKDPKALQTELTKFSAEDIVLGISNAAAKAGVPHIIGDWVGTVASAILTPIRHIKDIFKDPSLLKVKQWISESSGTPFRNFKSVGHVLTSVGVLSGLFATVGGIFGKMERLGELSESGFNSIGRWALSAATAIPAIGIIANGFEVAANAEGIPKTTRSLESDGKTIVYNQKRAGLSQVVAGILYAVIPWFDLSKPLPSSAFDCATAGFFGIPGLKIGVAAEEEYTALKEAENSLFKGPYFKHNEEKILPSIEVASNAEISRAIA